MEEIVAQRRENSKTFNLGGSRRGLEISAGAIHYKNNYADNEEQWKEIDTTIVDGRITKAPYILTIDIANKSIHVKNKKDGAECTLTLNGLKTNGITTALASVTPTTKGNTVTWKDIATDTDLVIEADSGRVRAFKRIIKSANAPNGAEFDIVEKGKPMLSVGGVDADGMPVEVTKQIADGKLTEIVDFTDKKFPIEIDPDITVQPPSKDTNLNAGNTDAADGTGTLLATDCRPITLVRPIVQFAITWGTDIPAGARIDLATFSLNYYGIYVADPVGRTMWAYRLTQLNWVEGTTEHPSTSGATWDNYECAGPTAWTAAGGDYTEDDGASLVVPNTTDLPKWMDWNVLDQVQYAQDETVDPAFLIKDGDESGAVRYGCRWRSKDHATAATRPKLYIEYTLIQTLLPSGIASAEAFGGPQVNLWTHPSAIASLEAFGTAVVAGPIIASGIASAEAFGTATLVLHLVPSGIATTEAVGEPQLNFIILATGITSEEAFGTLQLHVVGRQLHVRVITSQYRKVKILTSQYRRVKAFTG